MAAIIDSFVGLCLNELQKAITEEAILILGVKEDLMELQQRMEQIKPFLNDAEQRGIEDSACGKWLGRLKDAMYDADDIIDLARSEGSKLLADHPQGSSGKPNSCTGFSPFSCFSNIRKRREIGVKINNLNKIIESIAKDKIFLTPEYSAQSTGKSSSASKVTISSHLVEPNLVGKEVMHACSKLVNLILANKDKKAYKVVIVGTGGVGKTTLAQKIYNDITLKGNFDKQAWVCVSKEYSKASVLRQILRIMEVRHDIDESIGELQSKLTSAIKEKSFFLVLDDVWQSDVWTNLLRTPLHAAATGTILFTTRYDSIPQELGAGYIHRVDLMSVDVGWELLWKSMNITDEKQVQNLKDIGIEIVRKCGRLPLAIMVIARVLASRDQSQNEWKKILNKSTWSMDKLPSEISGALYLSYEDLPQHLKQCFKYCVVYTEDSDIYHDDITKMWIDEGFIEEQEGQLLEDTAEEYYYELVHRNLLQPDYSNFLHNVCKMHDLIRQLACHLTRDECFVGDPESLGGNILCRLRCISVVTEKDMVVIPSIGKEQVKVRTFAIASWSLRVEDTIFKRFLHLRVLDLTGSQIQSIPSYIGNLIHLRLLDLESTSVTCLPESIGSLKNLRILNLPGCGGLQTLPLATTQLHNLRCLCLRQTPINQVPKGISRLKLLNDLEGFPIGIDNGNTSTQYGWPLEELVPLLHLRRITIIKLERAVHRSTDPILLDKKSLKILSLRCTKHKNRPYLEVDVNNIEKIFELLIPPHSLEDLVIEGFFGRRYPTWLCSTYLSSLKYLNIIHCKLWVHLPPLGQLPNLRYLRIVGATSVSKIGPEFVGRLAGNPTFSEAVAFPKLEWLIIDNLPNWEEWSIVEQYSLATTEGANDGAEAKRKREAMFPRLQLFPRLEKLDIARCPKLRALPEQLAQAGSLRILQLRKAGRLKIVENLHFLSDLLLITGCGCLERVSNLPVVERLNVRRCPRLTSVDRLGSLRQLSLGARMRKISLLWMPGLQQQCQQLHGEALDVIIR
uniref:AAA+ ATPase domain-containing protein n=1 Tax=Oryza glumipatula TaxID=40148 RepID=A0A0E0BQ96_9ORYZ